RFRIRWSLSVSGPDGAVVIDYVPTGKRASNNALVCPSQTDATACCATCGLCWEASAKRECIAFIKHGRHTLAAEAAPMTAEQVTVPSPSTDHRLIRPVPIAGLTPSAITTSRPRFIEVNPRKDLIVETKYQRDLSQKSVKLIRRIVERFDWAKFKPPVCV